MLIVSVLVFVAMRATTNPGVLVGPGVTSEDARRFREDLGLDNPAHEQYLTWLGNFVQGDLGMSLQTRRDVWPELWEAIRNTLQLGIFAYVFYVAAGMLIGIVAALKHNSMVDHTVTGTSFLFLSVPQFFLGLMLQVVVGLYFVTWLGGNLSFLSDRIAVTNGTRFDMWSSERLWAMILPALAVAAQQLAIYSRYMRSSMLDVLNADYLRTARAKGVPERRVVLRHGLRNALVPVVTFSAIDVGVLITGLIVTEQVFNWSGMGAYFLNAFGEGDYVRVLPWTMIVVGSVILFNLLADLMYGVLDPRVRHG